MTTIAIFSKNNVNLKVLSYGNVYFQPAMYESKVSNIKQTFPRTQKHHNASWKSNEILEALKRMNISTTPEVVQ